MFVNSRNVQFFIYFLCLSINLHGQIKIPFEHLKTESGFSFIRDIYRDEFDYLWIANEGFGLIRYDTYKMINYIHDENDSTSISSDYVMKIFEDTKNNLWILTINSLDLLNRETGTFKHYLDFSDKNLDAFSRMVYDMTEDKNGRLWIATGNGLYEYLDNQDTIVSHTNNNATLAQKNLTGISLDVKNGLWLGCIDPGIFHYDINNRKFTYYEMDRHKEFSNTQKRLFVDSDNLIWIAMPINGLAYFNPITKNFKYFNEKRDGTGIYQKQVHDLNEFYKGKIYIATDQGGINIYDKTNESFEYVSTKHYNAGNLSSDGISCFATDKEGILWVGTTRGGINYYNPKKNKFNTLKTSSIPLSNKNNKHLSYGVVGAFLEDSKGKIWIGTDGGGINVYDRESGFIEVFTSNNSNLSSNTIRALSEDSNGDIWVATWASDVNKYIRKEKRFIQVDFLTEIDSSKKNERIWSVKVDNKDRFWVNFTEGDVFLLDKQGKILMHKNTSPYRNYDHYYNEVIFIDDFTEIFVNTTDGIFRFNEIDTTLELFIPENYNVSLRKDKHANYWVGTLNRGVYCYNRDGELLARYNTDNGLSSNYTYSIECSDNGIVWLTTNKGLNQIIASDSTVLHFYDSDGLQSNQYFMQASMKTRDGQLFYGGINGVDYFYPRDITRNTFMPKIYIKSFSVNSVKKDGWSIDNLNKIQVDDETIELKWNENMVTFEFYAINYTFPEKTAYKYNLLGLNKEMEYITTSSNFATYTNLKPGKYTFSVMASNNDGIWNEKPKTLKIRIYPPWWGTLWFRLLMVVFIVGSVLAFYFFRMQRMKSIQKKLEIKVDERTKELQEVNTILEESKEEITLQNEKIIEQNNDLVASEEELRSLNEELYSKNELLSEQKEELRAILIKLKETQAQLVQSEKMASIGVLAAGIAHEINNPLNYIQGGIYAIEEFLKEKNSEYQEEIDPLLENIEIGVSRVVEIIKYMNYFSRKNDKENQKCNLHQIMDNCLFMLQNEIKNRIKIIKRYTQKNHTITGNEGKLHQVFLNVFTNSCHAIEDKGEIIISTELKGDNFLIVIEDSGMGISKENINKVMDPFFTTKDPGIGTGLGMSIVYLLIQEHNGEISYQSVEGTGTKVTIILPVLQ